MRLVQILTNLLENAALYQYGAGKIWLSAHVEVDWIVVRVRDSGMGISASLLPHLFEMFVQDERPLARSQGGMGDRTDPGPAAGGTSRRDRDGAQRGTGARQRVRRPASRARLASQGRTEAVPGGPREESLPAPKRVSVLVVEDNVDAALSLAGLLNELGYETQTAFDGPSALEAARSARPAVILLDIGLPGMDGYEVAKRLRAESRFRNVPLAAVTGYSQDEDRKRAAEAGFDRHFTKPVDLAAMRDFLAAAATATS